MAASKEAQGSVDFADFPCAVCRTRDRQEIESSHYCVDCDANMCAACAKSHACYPAMVSHQVVDAIKGPDTHVQKVPLPTQRCEEHHDRIVDRYCEDHKETACVTCINEYHRNCNHVKYIWNVAKGVFTSQEFQTIKQSTDEIVKELKKTEVLQKKTLQLLDESEDNYQLNVQNVCTKLRSHITGVERSELNKIKREFHKKKGAIQMDMEAVELAINATESTSMQLKKLNDGNESEIFVCVKQAEKTHEAAKKTLDTVNQTGLAIPSYILFEKNVNSFKSVTSLGKMMRNTALSAQVDEAFEKCRADKLIKVPTDSFNCDITGICLLPDASCIIADRNNNNLKRFSPSFTGALCLPGGPFDVCYTDNNEVAVTLPVRKEVQFASTEATMKISKSFNVGYTCNGIAHSNSELFICCDNGIRPSGGSVRVFDLTGTALRTIQHSTTGEPIFNAPRYLSVSICGSKIHVTDTEKGILTVDMAGNIIPTYTVPEIKGAAGICALKDGGLFVCGTTSDNVVNVSENGEKLAVVLTKVHPMAICFDCVNNKLLVSSELKDHIMSYEIKIDVLNLTRKTRRKRDILIAKHRGHKR